MTVIRAVSALLLIAVAVSAPANAAGPEQRPYSCRLLDDEQRRCAFGSCDARTRRRLLRAARAFAKEGAVPPCVDEPGIYTQVRSGDFVADAKIAWRDAYDMHMRAAVRTLQQAAE